MQVRAVHKTVRISPRKMRLVVDSLRGKSVEQALVSLTVMPKRAGLPVEKTLKSALANAVNNAKLERDNLFIASMTVTGGQALKRFRPSTRGRVHPYKKRTSHLEIVLEEKGGQKIQSAK